jgi:uncharacterized repeat protein (TIGR01451 family)
MKLTRRAFAELAPMVVLTALFIAAPFHTAMAQVAPPLGTTQSFAVLGGASVVNTGSTVIIGDVGVDPGTVITGFPPGTETGGTIHQTDAVAGQAQIANTAAYLNLAGQTPVTESLTGTDLGGLTLVPGVYSFSTSAQLTGMLTLDAGGNSAAVWVFQIGSTLTTASSSSVVLINGAAPCNVFWQVGSSATLGSTTNFVGNVFALTSITLITGATVEGRLLAQTGTVTMDSNTVSISACGATTGAPGPPTLSKAFSPATINAGGTSTLTITLSNPNTTAASLSAPFTDTLPSGVVVSGSASTTCTGGALTATAGSSAVTLTGGSIPVNGSCVLTVDVAAASGGSYINSLAIGALVTSNGSSAAPAVATLTVNAPALVAPTLGKAFSPSTISMGGSSTLTITLSNVGTTPATLTAPLTDTLPSGVAVAGSASTTCVGGTVSTTGGTTATPSVVNRQPLTRQPSMRAVAFRIPAKTLAWLTVGTSTVTLTGGTVPAGGSCTVTVPVTAPVAGSYFNALAAGALQTSNGNNAAPAVATLTVIPVIPPTLSKSFSPATILAGGSSTLTITLNNPNNAIATLTAPLTDTLPGGVVVAGSISSTCIAPPPTVNTQQLTRQPRIETVAFRIPAKVRAWLTTGTSTVSMTGGSIPAASSCTVTVPVTAPVAGSYTNTLPVGALQTNLGSNTITGAATLAVGTITANVTPGTSATIAAGSSANFTLSLASTNGVSGLVSFGCAGIAATLNCTFNPSQATVPASGPVTTMLTVAVNAKPSSASVPNGPPDFWPNPSALHMVLTALFFLMVPVITVYCRKDVNLAVLTRWLPALALVPVLAIGLVSCGGRTTGSAGSSSTTGTSSGTSVGSGSSSGSGGTSGGAAGGDSSPVTTQFTVQAQSGSVTVDLSTLTVTVP